MPKQHGRNTSIYLESTAGASTSFSGDANSATFNYSVDAPEVTSFGDNVRQNLSGGIRDFELSLDGFANEPGSTACDARAIIQNGGATLLQFGWAGSTSGCPKVTASVILTEFNTEQGIDDAITYSLTCIPRTGSATFGAWT